MKALLLLLLACMPAHAAVYAYAPVYTPAAPGVLKRVGSFRHQLVFGLTILYCTIESTSAVKVMCVVRHATKDRLLLVEMEATEHKT